MGWRNSINYSQGHIINIFTFGSSLEATIFVLKNNLWNSNNFAHGAKDLDLFITIYFAKGFLNGRKKIIIWCVACTTHTYLTCFTWNVKFKPKDPNSILGGGLYQFLMVFKIKDKYPLVINWVYTHLLISFEYCSNNQFWYNNHGSWNFKKSRNFPMLCQFLFINSSTKIIYSLKYFKN